ncbi:hypothetical protein ATB93_03070 [Sphingomonas sp. WG]|nr:hypothetical protein ATB93_03070 [Sphingomonas sp. WG]
MLIFDQRLYMRNLVFPFIAQVVERIPDATEWIVQISRIGHTDFVSKVLVKYRRSSLSLTNKDRKNQACAPLVKLFTMEAGRCF